MPNTTAHVALLDGLADWEVGYLMAELNTGRFTRTAWSVRTVAASTEPVVSMGGLRMLPDLRIEDVEPAESGLLILPGATSWQGADGEALVELARRFLDAGVPVAAICGATEALAAAGLLDHRRHTSGAAEALTHIPGYAGADLYVDDWAVVDDHLITAGPQSPVQFARATLGHLGLASEETLEAWEKVFHAGDPSGYEVLMRAHAA